MKKFVSIIIAVLMCVMLSLPAFAGNSGFAFDYSDSNALIAEDKLEILNEKAEELEKDYGFNFYYVIAPDLGGFDSAKAYATDIFTKKSSAGDEGAVFLYVVSEDECAYYSSEGAKKIIGFDKTQMFYDCFNLAGTYYEAGSSCYAYMKSLLMAQDASKIAELKQVKPQSTDNTASAESKEIPSERQMSLVVDYADVLTAEQETALNEKLKAYSAECESDIAFATVESTYGVNLTAFADDFYDYNGYGYGENDDGMLMVMSMDDRQWWITTYGKCKKAFSDDDLKAEVSKVSSSLKNDDFNTAFNALADSFNAKIKKVGKVSPLMIPVALAIGFAIAYFIMKVRTANLKSVVAQVSADNYVVPDSLVMKYSNDCFLYSNITKTPKPSSSNNSGSHTSSSGRSHGGAGGSF